MASRSGAALASTATISTTATVVRVAAGIWYGPAGGQGTMRAAIAAAQNWVRALLVVRALRLRHV